MDKCWQVAGLFLMTLSGAAALMGVFLSGGCAHVCRNLSHRCMCTHVWQPLSQVLPVFVPVLPMELKIAKFTL